MVPRKKYGLLLLTYSICCPLHLTSLSTSDAKSYLSHVLAQLSQRVIPTLEKTTALTQATINARIRNELENITGQGVLQPPLPTKPSITYPVKDPIAYIQKAIDEAHLDPSAKQKLYDLSIQQISTDKAYSNKDLQKFMTDAIAKFKGEMAADQATYTQTDAWLRNPENYSRYHTWFMGGKTRLDGQIKPLTDVQKKSPLFKSYNPIRGSIYTYYDIVQECLRNEANLLKSHYVFYTAHDYRLRVAFDLNTALYEREFNTKVSDYLFLRSYKVDRYENLPPLNQWMDGIIEKYGEISDYGPETAGFLLSTNLSLFGEIGRPNSNTWKYFIKSQSANAPPMGLIFDETLKSFIEDPAQRMHIVYVLTKLAETIETPEGNLLQIFIPTEKVNESAYLSKPRAKVWDEKLFDITQDWDEKKERYTKISTILDLYRNKPAAFGSKLDQLEARVMPRKEYFAFPRSGVKIFRFTTLDSEREKIYLKRLGIIADFIYDQYQKNTTQTGAV